MHPAIVEMFYKTLGVWGKTISKDGVRADINYF